MDKLEAIKLLTTHLKHVNIVRLEVLAKAEKFPQLTVDEVWKYIVDNKLEENLYLVGYRPQNTPVGDSCLFKEDNKYYEFFADEHASGWNEYPDLETPARRKLFNILYFLNKATAT